MSMEDNTMRTTPRSETEALKLAERKLFKPGWYDAQFREAVERPSKRGNEMIEVVLAVTDADNERQFRDYLVNSVLGVAVIKLRHACAAVNALEKYEAGEITQDDFPGRACRVHVIVEKKRGFPDRNVIDDYAPLTVNLPQVG